MSNQKLKEEVGALVGEASMCWSPRPKGVFDSTAAINVTDRILALFPTKEAPWLGLASTAQLLDELKARAVIGGYLEYRTVEAD